MPHGTAAAAQSFDFHARGLFAWLPELSNERAKIIVAKIICFFQMDYPSVFAVLLKPQYLPFEKWRLRCDLADLFVVPSWVYNSAIWARY
jgi:hypothetical protein